MGVHRGNAKQTTSEEISGPVETRLTRPVATALNCFVGVELRFLELGSVLVGLSEGVSNSS